jgi:phosphoribosyl 1,2-cyclic phosphodiesterase
MSSLNGGSVPEEKRLAAAAATSPLAPGQTGDGIAVAFWGVRGSFTVADRRVERYGGNTACVAVRAGNRLFVVDAGSGIIGLGQAIDQGLHRTVDILVSHLHHDHISGLAFFEPLYHAENTVRIHCGHLGGQSAEAALTRMFDQPLFPLRLSDLPARIEHVGFRAGETLAFDGVSVATILLEHPGGATGYRFDHGGCSVCYVSDVEHAAAGPDPQLVRFVTGADLVIYDAMFTEHEYESHVGWGHSTCAAGVALCRAAGAKALAAFHHHPFRDDAALDRIDAELDAALPGSFVAREDQSWRMAPGWDDPAMMGT